jgi:uncharacterized protein
VRTIDPNATGEPNQRASLHCAAQGTLGPLLLAGVVTLEIAVLIGLPLKFANIIALPLLLDLRVAFKIYFVMAWRGPRTFFNRASRAPWFSAQ